jgi:hypothetical protein
MKLLCRLFIVCLFLLDAFAAASQSTKKDHVYYYIISDTAKVRAQPGFSGEVMKTFRKGDSVAVLKVGKIAMVKGMAAPWFEVGYRLGNAEKRGVIWGGYLSRKKH